KGYERGRGREAVQIFDRGIKEADKEPYYIGGQPGKEKRSYLIVLHETGHSLSGNETGLWRLQLFYSIFRKGGTKIAPLPGAGELNSSRGGGLAYFDYKG